MRLTFVNNERDNSTAWRADWEWPEAAHHLTTHRRLPAKGELGVIFARFVDGPCRRLARTGKCTAACPGNDHRIDENVEAVTALGLDFDDAPEPRLRALLQTLAADGIRHIWYTTWSSTPTVPKIRVVIALDAEVPAAQFCGFWDAVVDDLGIRDIVDTKCRNPGRLFFTPQCAENGVPSSGVVNGAFLETGKILARVTPDTPPVSENEDTDYPPASPALLQHALTRLQAHGPAISGAGGNAHTRAAWGILVNDLALSDTEARAVFRLWDLGNQPPWGDEAFAGPARSDQAWSNPRGAERDRFEGTRANIFGELPPEPALDEYGLEGLGEDPGDSPDEWIQEGLIAAGVPQTTAGHPKSYKTFLMEYLFVCSALGVDAFGKFKCKRTRGLMLPREDSARETRRRIHLLARGICHQFALPFDQRDLDEWLRIDSIRPFYWTNDNDMNALARTIQRRRIGMVMIDSLTRTHLGDENAVKDLQPVLNRWGDLCQQLGVAVSVIHHFTKSGSGTLLQQLRGSGSIGAHVRHIVGVEKAKTRGEPFELSFDGNLHPLPDPFEIQMLDATNTAGQKIITFNHKSGPTAYDMTNLRQHPAYQGIVRVLEVLLHEEERQTGRPMTVEALQRAAGMGTATRKEAIAAAVGIGLVNDAAEPYGVALTELGRVTARRILLQH